MAYKCLDCGHIFEDGEEGHCHAFGEYCGNIYSIKERCCPLCGGDFKETIRCDICSSEYLQDELHFGLCDDCIDCYINDVEICYKFGKKDEQEIKINGFLATIFEKDAIEEILYSHLLSQSNIQKIDCSEYINQDRDWFAKEVKKNEDAKG